ncbi:MAG: ATP-binding protein [Candidatus Woesearchaeota archaeon]|nr:ATP-binding protein [Candidatus Woesearchaeota archaeon]
MNLEKHNPHWKEHFVYPFTLDRNIFKLLSKNISNRPIVTISGLRRTGKTVLMQQLINTLLQEKIDRTHILYYSFDEEQPKIEEIVQAFEKLTNIDKNKTKLYVFFDEIQKLEDWQNQIKYYYDTSTIKFFVSGSSSLFIQKKSKESLAGRSFDFYLSPLSFREFLVFRKKEALITKDKLFQGELKKEFALYIKRQFVETVDEHEEFITSYVKSILEKVVYIDIPKVFAIDHQDLLMRLLKIIASNPGMIIEYESLARELGINRTTLSNYLFYLEEAFLIKKIYNFSRNRITSEKKLKKFYLSSTSFFPYLSPETDESKLIENLVAIETHSKFFWRTPFKDEVDFVLEKFHNQEICPVEVKYKNTISAKDAKTLISFCKKMDLNEGIIITKDLEEKKLFTKDNKHITIHFIPVWKFLLSL